MQLRCFVATVLLASAGSLEAQQAATAPASSAIYDRLEAVSARFPARGVFLGERALSRRELLRVTHALRSVVEGSAAADRAWAVRELDLIESVLADMKTTRPRGSLRTGVAWRSDLFATSAATERIESNGQGQIDAITNPFMSGRHGWPALQGTTATLAPTVVASLGRRLAVVVQPTASLTSMRAEGWVSERLLHRAYVRGTLFNVAVALGTEEHRWGQSPSGSLFISGNAMPLPALTISTDTAITLPWLFRHAGRVRATGFISDLGPGQDPPHARLVGWQASVHPWPRFELGVAVTAQTGGNGGPPATFLRRVVDLFPIIDALAPQHADLQISNKLAGGNLRLRFPEWSGLDVYYELQIDDFDGRRLRSSFVDDAAHLIGLRLPVRTSVGELATRLEWHRTSLRLYEHTQFRSGSTYRRHLIGNPLGPHAAAGVVSATWRPSPLRSLELSAWDERRDPAQYISVVSGPRDAGLRFVRASDDPDHRRRRAVLVLDQVVPGGSFRFGGGYNRAWRTGQAGQDEWMGLVSFSTQRMHGY